MKVSIFDLVVGDIVQLNIGDQVIFEVFSVSISTLISLLLFDMPSGTTSLGLVVRAHGSH